MNDWKIKSAFHEDHFRCFISRESHLQTEKKSFMSVQQTIHLSKIKRQTEKNRSQNILKIKNRFMMSTEILSNFNLLFKWQQNDLISLQYLSSFSHFSNCFSYYLFLTLLIVLADSVITVVLRITSVFISLVLMHTLISILDFCHQISTA